MADIFAMVDTWNNGATTFTALKMNVTDTASAAASLLMDLQIGGASKEKTDKNGAKTLAGLLTLLQGQIKFPATQAASADPNTLDDYEEGTFTPTIDGTTTAGVGTYDDQSGKYAKIGNFVFVIILLKWTAHTGTGNMQISGLPFTNTDKHSASVSNPVNLTLNAGNLLTSYVALSSTRIDLTQYPTGGGADSAVAMDTNATIRVSAGYFVA